MAAARPLPLPASTPGDGPPEAPRPDPRPRPEQLWLALDLPRLALDAVWRGVRSDRPVAVVDGEGPRAPVVAACDRAVAAGVMPGQRASAACVLVPDLRVVPRETREERSALEGLAAWAGRFTSRASLVEPDALVLEIGASLRLFGGLDPLRAAIDEGVTALGYRARIGVAPTPLAATLLARAEPGSVVAAPEALASRLAAVPVAALRPGTVTLEALRRIGVTRIGECLRLPRDGLARRYGRELLEVLDRALGTRPDPRRPWTAPPVFERGLGLPGEVCEREALLFAARRLLLELEGFLAGRAGGVTSLEICLAHRSGVPATRFVLEPISPSRDARRLLDLLATRLERLALPEAVLHVGIRAAEIVGLAPSMHDLWDDDAAAMGQAWEVLVERLRTRLGRDAVHGIAPAADHRPERAWRKDKGGEEGGEKGDSSRGKGGQLPFSPCENGNCPPFPPPSSPRPLWLLEEPLPLGAPDGLPCLGGRLRACSRVERIESGWWDGGDVARDYRVAVNPAGERFWIFRERRGSRRWFLHGVFG